MSGEVCSGRHASFTAVRLSYSPRGKGYIIRRAFSGSMRLLLCFFFCITGEAEPADGALVLSLTLLQTRGIFWRGTKQCEKILPIQVR